MDADQIEGVAQLLFGRVCVVVGVGILIIINDHAAKAGAALEGPAVVVLMLVYLRKEFLDSLRDGI